MELFLKVLKECITANSQREEERPSCGSHELDTAPDKDWEDNYAFSFMNFHYQHSTPAMQAIHSKDNLCKKKLRNSRERHSLLWVWTL